MATARLSSVRNDEPCPPVIDAAQSNQLTLEYIIQNVGAMALQSAQFVTVLLLFRLSIRFSPCREHK